MLPASLQGGATLAAKAGVGQACTLWPLWKARNLINALPSADVRSLKLSGSHEEGGWRLRELSALQRLRELELPMDRAPLPLADLSALTQLTKLVTGHPVRWRF